MIEISIVVQVREIAGDKAGQLDVGFARFKVETLTPKKEWSGHFFDAIRRAMTKRQDRISGVVRQANRRRSLFDRMQQSLPLNGEEPF